jgi:hypothetical protein
VERVDLTGDGTSDILWQFDGGEVPVWNMTGGQYTTSGRVRAGPRVSALTPGGGLLPSRHCARPDGRALNGATRASGKTSNATPHFFHLRNDR